MAFTPAPGVCEVVHHFGTTGGPQYNIYHVLHSDGSAWDNAAQVAVGNVFKTWNQGTANAFRQASIFSIEFRMRDLSVQAGAEAIVSDLTNGTNAGAPLPNNCTLAIKASTGVAGRSHRGRTYWVGLSENMTTGDQIITTVGTNIVNALGTLVAAVNAIANTKLCVLSGQENKVKLNPRVGHPINTFLLADTNLDSQRRRLTGHNIHR